MIDMEEIEKQIETLIKEISVDEMREIIDIPEITRCEIELHPQLLIGPRKEKILQEIYPISQRWEMTHAIGAVAHSWQLDDLPNGNYQWADDPIVDISDIWIQIYKNGWIIIVRNAQDVRGIYDPEKVASITTLKNEMKERDMKQINARIAWAAMSQSPLFPDRPIIPDQVELSQQIGKIAKAAMQIARKTGHPPFDACEAACGRKHCDGIDAYQFRSMLMTREATAEYEKQMQEASA